MVCNLVTYRARSAVREVGYALGFPRPLVDRVAKALETYDSVMVRRDLEADGGFAEFFRRPGEGLPAEAGAAREAEVRGFVDGMGQLEREVRGRRRGARRRAGPVNTRLPLVGKVPPWKQPPQAGRPERTAAVRLAARRGGGGGARAHSPAPAGDSPRDAALPPAANPSGFGRPSEIGPVDSSGMWEGAPESPPAVRARRAAATTRAARATRRRASPGCDPAGGRATPWTASKLRPAGARPGPGDRPGERHARAAAAPDRPPRPARTTGTRLRNGEPTRARLRPALRGPRRSSATPSARGRRPWDEAARARSPASSPSRRRSRSAAVDEGPLRLGALARVLRPHRRLPAPPLDPLGRDARDRRPAHRHRPDRAGDDEGPRRRPVRQARRRGRSS